MHIMIGLIRPFKVLLLDEITTSLDRCVRQDLLHWIIKDSNELGATILYATHIFDGLDDWATNLRYPIEEVKCGWQGKIQDLEKHQKLKEENHPSKMLAIADHWLRAELERNHRSKRAGKSQGELAQSLNLTYCWGGFSSGRNIQTEIQTLVRK